MNTIEAMKQIREKLVKGDLLCEVVAVSMLDEAIKREEAQSVEPVAWMKTFNHGGGKHTCVVSLDKPPTNGFAALEQVTPLFAHPAPAKQPLPAEREALIERLRDYTNCNDSDVDDAADMLADDARVPMTDERIDALADAHTSNFPNGGLNYGKFARAIEAHHGIKPQGDSDARKVD